MLLGLSDTMQFDVIRLTSSVLHLGNISFVESGNYAAVENEDCEFHFHIICNEKVKILGFIGNDYF